MANISIVGTGIFDDPEYLIPEYEHAAKEVEYKGDKFKWDHIVCTISEEESLLEMKSDIGIVVNFKNRFDMVLMTIKYKDEPEVSINEDVIDEYVDDIFDIADGTCVGLINELLRIRPWD